MRFAIIESHLRENRENLPADAKGLREYIIRTAKDAGFSLPDGELKRLVKQFGQRAKQPE
mgnify:CR=1 FL=1